MVLKSLSLGIFQNRIFTKQLSFFANWKGASPLIDPQIVPNLTSKKVYLVDKPDVPQSVVRLVRRGLPFDATGELYA